MTVVVGSEGAPGAPQDEPRLIRVEPSDVGERLDRWLSGLLPEHSRSAIRRFIDEGRVTIGAKRCRASHKMLLSEVVLFDPPPIPSVIPLPEDHQLDVLHQDDELIVISKDAGMIVHPAPGAAPEGTLVNALLGHTEKLSSVGDPGRPGIVHRLDRETSGVMVIARTDAVHRELSRQFHDREVSKEYLALSHGTPTTTTGEIDLPLARSLTDPKKRVVRHDQQARDSFTAWKLVRKLGEGQEGSACWFHCFPRTGRTHQIRVHLRAIGHPILCDFLYGRESSLELSRWDGDAPPARLQRHALHAWRLHFRHPGNQQLLQFEAPLAADLKPWWESATPLDPEQ